MLCKFTLWRARGRFANWFLVPLFHVTARLASVPLSRSCELTVTVRFNAFSGKRTLSGCPFSLPPVCFASSGPSRFCSKSEIVVYRNTI
ncbi:hypothetical protein EDB83DRAFT_1508874 [Lactarius deliciosus]|nr:hypothetical protein EDB83DRAFT_1508874 [Lactarius deliciosus]